MKEYEALRAEIIAEYAGIRQYENVLFTAVVAILAFTINGKHYYVCLLPYIVIISVYLTVMSVKYGICRISAYMIVFLEGREFNWEVRHDKFDRRHDPRKKPLKYVKNSQYYLLSLTCSSVTLLKLWMSTDYSNYYKIGATIAICVFTGIVIVVLFRSSFDYLQSRPDMIKKWERIKKEEIKNSRLGIYQPKPFETTNDSAVAKTIIEMSTIIVESCKSKEDAIEKLKSLSIMKELT